jgi:hypothetical protein
MTPHRSYRHWVNLADIACFWCKRFNSLTANSLLTGNPISRKVREVPISSVFTMSPITVADALSPMPAAKYIR